jgi:hypothetical protein
VVGQLHLLDAQRRVDHVEDRRIAELEEGVLRQARHLLPGQLVVGGKLLDRGLDVVAAGGDALDLRVRLRLVLLQPRELQVRGAHLVLDFFHLAPGAGRGLRAVGQVVFVRVARRVEGGLQELGVLVRPVDLRVQLLQVGSQLRESPRVGLLLVAGLDEIPAQLVPLLAVRLLPRRLRGLAGLVPIQSEERLLNRLPVAFVVGDDHPEEHRRQQRAETKKARFNLGML